MAAHLPELDREALKRFREVARLLQSSRRRSLPIEELLDIASTARFGPGITIDFEASHELGDALIILRIPTSPPDPTSHLGLACLTQREREVAQFVARGLSNKQIAQRLCIATSTVKDHLHNILQKTNLPNRTAIATACSRSPDGV